MRFLAFALVLSCAAVARATVLVPLDTEALTARADRVVLGVVESQQAHWTTDHQAIYTDVVVRVSKSYKGTLTPGARVTVRREGGSLDGLGMRVFGAADFAVGEEVVLFIETRGGASYTVGMTQGKLHVFAGSDGQKRVAPDLSAVAFISPQTGKIHEAEATTATKRSDPRRLDELEQQIRSYVRSHK
jgi:hypothetical protein